MVQWTVFLISYWGDQIGQKVKKICDWCVNCFKHSAKSSVINTGFYLHLFFVHLKIKQISITPSLLLKPAFHIFTVKSNLFFPQLPHADICLP